MTIYAFSQMALYLCISWHCISRNMGDLQSIMEVDAVVKRKKRIEVDLAVDGNLAVMNWDEKFNEVYNSGADQWGVKVCILRGREIFTMIYTAPDPVDETVRQAWEARFRAATLPSAN